MDSFDAVEQALAELDAAFKDLEMQQRRAAAAQKRLAAAYAAVNAAQTDEDAAASVRALLSVESMIADGDRGFK
jgi:hypothetical protein